MDFDEFFGQTDRGNHWLLHNGIALSVAEVCTARDSCTTECPSGFSMCAKFCFTARCTIVHSWKLTRCVRSLLLAQLTVQHSISWTFKLMLQKTWIIIIITRTIFIVLPSWQRGHCGSLLGSFDECRTAPTAADPQTKSPDLGCESACRLLSSTITIAIYYYYSARKLILIYRPTEGRRLSWHRHCRKGAHSPCPRL